MKYGFAFTPSSFSYVRIILLSKYSAFEKKKKHKFLSPIMPDCRVSSQLRRSSIPKCASLTFRYFLVHVFISKKVFCFFKNDIHQIKIDVSINLRGLFRLQKFCCNQLLMQYVPINWTFFYFYCNALHYSRMSLNEPKDKILCFKIIWLWYTWLAFVGWVWMRE